MREPGEDDDRDPTDLGLSARAPAYMAPEQAPAEELPPPIPGAAMSDAEIAERLSALGLNITARDVARLDERARAERIAWFERKRREESK